MSRSVEDDSVPLIELPAASVVTARKRIYLPSATKFSNSDEVISLSIVVFGSPL